MTNEELEQIILELKEQIKELKVKVDFIITEIKILKEGGNI